MYKLAVFIPQENKEAVKAAMFEAGAGRLGNYDCCSFEYEGTGQFRPLVGSRPHLGIQGEVETVNEVKVEMVVETAKIRSVLVAMKAAHPYETVAYDLIQLVNEDDL